MSEDGPAAKQGCFKRGCFGCLVVTGGMLAFIVVIALIAVVRGTPEVVSESGQLVHDIPAGEWTVPEGSEPLLVDEGQLGRVILDVRMTSFKIVPAPAGTPLRLDVNYDSGSYELKESFEPSGELGWTYRLDFGKRSAFQFFHVDSDNRLELHVPAGTPIALSGELGIGEFELELGGLWIESVDLETGIGNHQFDFEEALPAPMKEFSVNGSIGELRVRRLGNASPASVRVKHSIGEIDVDLSGAWKNDSEIVVGSSIGGCRVRLPDEGIGFELLGASVTLGEADSHHARQRPDAPPGAPVLRLSARHTLGELRLID